MNESTPEATELVYVPEPSWSAPMLAFSLALVLAGIFVWFPYGVIGAVLGLVALGQLFRSASEDAERLPRRQKLTTAVLPAVPPRKRD